MAEQLHWCIGSLLRAPSAIRKGPACCCEKVMGAPFKWYSAGRNGHQLITGPDMSGNRHHTPAELSSLLWHRWALMCPARSASLPLFDAGSTRIGAANDWYLAVTFYGGDDEGQSGPFGKPATFAHYSWLGRGTARPRWDGAGSGWYRALITCWGQDPLCHPHELTALGAMGKSM